MGTSENGSAALTNEQIINQFRNENFNELQAAGGNTEGRDNDGNRVNLPSIGSSNSDRNLRTGQGGEEVTTDFPTPEPASPKEDPLLVNSGNLFESNILSTYDNPTYNFRFFMTKENAEHRDIDTQDIIVIAETGSTGFNIQDVTISNTVGPGQFTKNTTAESITFKILEPHGTSLLDQMRTAGIRLNVFDHRNAPFWLELTFKGYTAGEQDSFEGGNPSESISTDELNNISFLWKIQVQHAEIEIDKGGSVYNFKAVPTSQVGLTDEARRLEKEEKIEAETLGEYFTILADRLNNYENYSLNSPQAEDITKRIRRYAFAFPDGKTLGNDTSSTERLSPGETRSAQNSQDMNTWVINSRSDDKFNSKRTKDSFAGTITPSGSNNKKTITFSSGTAIEAIIQEVIGATQQGQSLAISGIKNRSTLDAGETNSNRSAVVPSTIFIVDPIVDYLSYNAVSNLYNLLITYHIKPYTTFKPVTNREQIKEFQGKSSNDRLRAMVRLSNVKKRYDYMFTGLNTEVLDYKINLNSAWHFSLPIFQGQNQSGVATSSELNNRAKANVQIKQQVLKPSQESTQSILTKKISELSTDELRDEALLRLETARQFDDIEEEEITRLEQVLARLESNADQDFNTGPGRVGTSRFNNQNNPIILRNDIRTSGNTTPVKNENVGFIVGSQGARDRITNRVAANRARNGNGSIFFVEDFEEKSVSLNISDLTDKNKKELISVSTEISPLSKTNKANIDSTATKGRSYFSAIMNQIYSSGGEMASLDLTIRGDPYWLGEPDPQKKLSPAATTGEKNRDLTNSDAYLFLSFGTAVDYGDGGAENNIDSHAGTGLAKTNIFENGFNGIYQVQNVLNEFSGGKFTQKLKGVIDPLTKEQDVIKLLTKDNI